MSDVTSSVKASAKAKPSIDELWRLASFLRRGFSSVGDAEEALARFTRLFHASSIVLAPGFDNPVWSLSRGVPEDWVRTHTRLAHQDPAGQRLPRSPVGTWWGFARDTTREEREAELAQRFHGLGLRDAVVVRVYSPFRDDLVFAMYRDEPFHRRELRALELLYPHLAGAVATPHAARLMDLERGDARRLSVEVRFPRAVVGCDLRTRRAVMRLLGGTITGGWPRVERAILVAAQRFLSPRTGGRSQVLWPGLRIDFAFVAAGQGDSVRLEGFLVQEDHVEASAQASAVPPLVAAVLSPRQCAVAVDFAAGIPLIVIAEGKRIGLETARSHLRAAYAKLGVSNRTELARALRGE